MYRDTNHLEERAQAGAMLVVYIVTYIFAIVVLLMDLLVWRPW
jgi:hypothetical protein